MTVEKSGFFVYLLQMSNLPKLALAISEAAAQHVAIIVTIIVAIEKVFITFVMYLIKLCPSVICE